ncbi:MAG: rhodanese-like domain-containing protein [Methylococcaceae bacterium]|jgi:rhodanese-related sulfurtransferase|nr:rhodanese-like domain-containing protein [Methylococcaceae bacterium]
MERKASIVVVLLLTLTMVTTAAAGSAVKNVTVGKAQTLMKERAGKTDFVILDVRTPEEFAEGHLDGAVNLDVQARDFEKKLRVLDRKKSYLVYCRTGNRSRKATVAMEALGFRSIFHMNEGIVKWKQQNLPLTRPS